MAARKKNRKNKLRETEPGEDEHYQSPFTMTSSVATTVSPDIVKMARKRKTKSHRKKSVICERCHLPTVPSSDGKEWRFYHPECVESYKAFPKLYEERKLCRQVPVKTSPHGFMGLPGEIRNKIYGYLLQTDGVIELWYDSLPTQYGHHLEGYLGTKQDRACLPHSFRQAANSLNILRISKHIHGEMSTLFYGTNEFRASHVNGAVMMAAFLRTIGQSNSSLIRKVAIYAPMNHGSFNIPGVHAKAREAGIRSLFERLWVCNSTTNRSPSFYWTPDACFDYVLGIFRHSGSLRSLRLVLTTTLVKSVLRREYRMERDELRYGSVHKRRSSQYFEKLKKLEDSTDGLEVVYIEKTTNGYSEWNQLIPPWQWGWGWATGPQDDPDKAAILEQDLKGYPRLQAVRVGPTWKLVE